MKIQERFMVRTLLIPVVLTLAFSAAAELCFADGDPAGRYSAHGPSMSRRSATEPADVLFFAPRSSVDPARHQVKKEKKSFGRIDGAGVAHAIEPDMRSTASLSLEPENRSVSTPFSSSLNKSPPLR